MDHKKLATQLGFKDRKSIDAQTSQAVQCATHVIKEEYIESPFWQFIKVEGVKFYTLRGCLWVEDPSIETHLKFYEKIDKSSSTDPVGYHGEDVPTETPEEAEAFNKMKPYEFDAHVSSAIAIGAKHDQNKPRYDLLPPIAIDELAKVMTFGAEKYAPNSWQTVPDALNRYRAALFATYLRHSAKLIDEESGLPHSALAMCNAAFIVELEKASK